MAKVIIPCSHNNYQNCPSQIPAIKLTVVYTYQRFESLYYNDIDGEVLETPYRPISTVIQSDPMNPFCPNCQLDFLDFFKTKSDGGPKMLRELSDGAKDFAGQLEVEDPCLCHCSTCFNRKFYFDIQHHTCRPFSDEELMVLVAGSESTEVCPTPASESAIETLETLEVEDLEAEVREENCTVCLEGFISDDNCGVIRRLPCKHLFHNDCIVEWLRTSHVCPLCRFELEVDQSDVESDDQDVFSDAPDQDDTDEGTFFDACDAADQEGSH